MSAPSDLADIVDLDRHPLDRVGSTGWHEMVEQARASLAERELFELPGLVHDTARLADLAVLAPLLEHESFEHRRDHTIYFRDQVDGLPADHGALRRLHTVNRTLCGDQLGATALDRLYRWPPLRTLLEATLDTGPLFLLADPLACCNVMSYGSGEALEWHFDRSAFTTTLLLQRPDAGGRFEYRTGLRDAAGDDHDGIARLVAGHDDRVRISDPAPGTLTVFRGRDTAHRVAAVQGAVPRVVAVFSFVDRPDVQFSDEERLGFYGRRGPRPTG